MSASKGQGKAKGKGKGKGNATPMTIDKTSKWQVQLAGDFKDYGDQEDMILKRAFLVGQPHAKFSLRGQDYLYDFRKMLQKNEHTGKSRSIRQPWKMTAPPQPILPPGPMTVIQIKDGQAGQIIEIDDPNNPGQKVQVMVPPKAQPGQKMAVPLPEKGQSVEEVQKKQAGWTTGGKVAAASALVVGAGAVFVGGAILGDHLLGGDAAATIAEGGEAFAAWAPGAAEAAGDWTADTATKGAEAVGEWAPGAWDASKDWVEGAAADAGEWTETAAGDAAEWTEGAYGTATDWVEGDSLDMAGDVADWLGDAGEDVGDFVMSLF